MCSFYVVVNQRKDIKSTLLDKKLVKITLLDKKLTSTKSLFILDIFSGGRGIFSWGYMLGKYPLVSYVHHIQNFYKNHLILGLSKVGFSHY